MISPSTGSGSNVRLPSEPTTLRYPGGAKDGQMPFLAFSIIPFSVFSARLSM